MSSFSQWFLGQSATKVSVSKRATHNYVIGQSGTGKSRAIENWVMQDIDAGRGVGVIDPHGDLYQNLVARLASKPEQWQHLILIDPLDPKWSVGFNPLAAGEYPIERLAIYLTDVAVKVWNISSNNAPRMVWLLTNTFLALSSLGLSLLDLPRFLTDNSYRDGLLSRLPHAGAQAFFQYEFPKREGAIHQWVMPVLNKLSGLIFDPDIRLMFAGGNSIDFRRLMDQRCILLVHLPKGIIGEGPSSLLAAFLVAHLQKAALSRANTARRPPFYLYLDEFQNYTTDNIQDILSESRKYALSLTLAHQYLDQLSNDLRSAVLNTAGTLVSFRVGYQDAYKLAKEIFPSPDFLSKLETTVSLGRSHLIPLPFASNRSDRSNWDALAQELTQLNMREFWSRKRGRSSPVKQQSFYMPNPVLSEDIRESILDMKDVVGKRHGHLKSQLQAEINARSEGHRRATNQNIGTDSSPPMWTE